MTSARSLAARVAAIEDARRTPLNATMGDAIDRPPQETREQWIDRKAAESSGAPYDSGAINSRGETRAQWIGRRERELARELGIAA